MEGESSQTVVKIDGILWDELDAWLETDDAKKKGFHSKAQFATQAVRELLEKYSVERFAYKQFEKLYKQSKSSIKNQEIKNLVDYLNYFKEHKSQLKVVNQL